MSHKDRKDMVERDHKVLSLSSQCKLLHISRGSLYYQAVGETAENLLIMRRMDELFMLYPFYGSRQMMRHLQREGFAIGRHRVRRLMKLMGLKAIYRQPRTSDPHPAHKTYPYLLHGLTITRPNHVWCTEPKGSAEQQNSTQIRAVSLPARLLQGFCKMQVSKSPWMAGAVIWIMAVRTCAMPLA